MLPFISLWISDMSHDDTVYTGINFCDISGGRERVCVCERESACVCEREIESVCLTVVSESVCVCQTVLAVFVVMMYSRI